MGKVHTKHILRLLWKMDENMFFLDSEHIGMRGKCPLPLLFLLSGEEISSSAGKFSGTAPSPKNIPGHQICALQKQ